MNHGSPRSLTLALLVASALLCVSRTGLAETDTERAARLYQQGNAAFEQKQWAEAEAAYLGAWNIAHTFDVAANLGVVEMHLGKHRAAAEFLAYSARTAPPSSKPAQRQRTQQLLDEAKAKVGTVHVKLSGPSATASIDGTVIATEDLGNDLFVDPGKHVLEASGAGSAPARVSFDVGAGEEKDVALALVPLPPERRSIVPLVVLATASAAALGVGIGTTVVSNAKSSDADTQRTAILNAGGQCVQPGKFATQCSDMKSPSRRSTRPRTPRAARSWPPACWQSAP